MARIRTIKPEFFDDEDLCALSFAHRLCYVGLWTQADKAGRMEDRPLRLKARIFPYDSVDMAALLGDLAGAGFIVRYESDGRRFLAVKASSWLKHQRPRQDEPESVIPASSGDSDVDPRGAPEPRGRADSSADEAKSLDSDESVTPQSLGKEGNGKEVEGGLEESVSSAPPAATEPLFLTFPVVGKGSGEWALSERQVDDWTLLYPALDIPAQCRQAKAWLDVNPGRRKTAKGMGSFLVNWFNRTNDRGGGRPANVSGHRKSGAATPYRESGADVESRKNCRHEPRCNSNDWHQALLLRERERGVA